MTRHLLMAAVIDQAGEWDMAEPVVVETRSEAVRFELDDGMEIAFDRADLLAALGVSDSKVQAA